jgi:hypothetical protein
VGLREQRAIVKRTCYKRGATVFLREALENKEAVSGDSNPTKRYVTNENEVIKERVNDFEFMFPAGLILTNPNLTCYRIILPE